MNPHDQANEHSDANVHDLLDVTRDTFDVLWHIVWEEHMTARAELAWAKYEQAVCPAKEALAKNLAVAEDMFAYTAARLAFLNDWELENQ